MVKKIHIHPYSMECQIPRINIPPWSVWDSFKKTWWFGFVGPSGFRAETWRMPMNHRWHWGPRQCHRTSESAKKTRHSMHYGISMVCKNIPYRRCVCVCAKEPGSVEPLENLESGKYMGVVGRFCSFLEGCLFIR